MDRMQSSFQQIVDMLRKSNNRAEQTTSTSSPGVLRTPSALLPRIPGWVQDSEARHRDPASRGRTTTLSCGSPIPMADPMTLSEDGSEDDFLLGPGVAMKDLIYRDEEERLRHEGHRFLNAGRPSGRTRSPDPLFSSGSKRIGLPIPTRRGDLLQMHLDPVDMKLCTEDEGRRLFDLWVQRLNLRRG